AGRGRAVYVQHVDPALPDPAADPRRRKETERKPRHRPVVRDRNRAAGRHHVPGERRVVVGGGNYRDLVPQADERLGQLLNVLLHPAGDIPGVGADHADLHGSPPPPPAAAPPARPSTAASSTWPLRAARSSPLAAGPAARGPPPPAPAPP